jgi:putative membrane protein
MKKLLRYTLFLAFGLVIENEIWSNLSFSPKIETIIKVALILAIFELILKPILKILLLPVTFLTLGLIRIVINTLGLYLAVFLISGFNVNSLRIFDFSLTGFLAYLFTSTVISTFLYIFKKL